MADLTLSDPLRPVVGTIAAKLDKHLGLRTVGDLMRHFPRRYLRLGELTAIADLPIGQDVTLVGEVVQSELLPMRDRRRKLMRVVVTDGTDRLRMTFFNAQRFSGAFTSGRRMLFSGRVEMVQWDRRREPERQLTHPTWTPIGDDIDPAEAANRPIPIYPLAGSLKRHQIVTAVTTVLDVLRVQPPVADPVPAEVLERHGLAPLGEALEGIHRPQRVQQAYAMRKRFSFEEAFVLQTVLARRRAEGTAVPATPRAAVSGGLLEAFDAALPFELTSGQRQVGEQLAGELAGARPMHRLLQGEVGSGKTVVALRAMLTVVDAGGQAALLAPTEVLAAQHHRSIIELLGPLADHGVLGGARGGREGRPGTKVALLTGSMSTSSRRAALLDAASGSAGIVIGTHALLQENVGFADLGLVVVDEQHRFGVEQREVLREKGRTAPHLLVMTATPIPRTVAMTVFGDLETSTLVEVPAGRREVSTHVVPLADRAGWYDRVWQRVAEEVRRGHQAFVVCPRIGEEDAPPVSPAPAAAILEEVDADADADADGEPETDGEPEADGEPDAAADADGSGPDGPARPLRGVLATLAELRERPDLAGLRIEMLHGRMQAEERESVMAAVGTGAVGVLVATTVIEVGVDVPNATVMVILDADRFGVSQLHQLRGRIGRGSAGGVCLLVTDAQQDNPARKRLEAVAATTDGFVLARVDLEQRREGDVLGAQQSGGRSSLRVLRALRDEALIEQARVEATAVVEADPRLEGSPALAAALVDLLDEEQRAYLERS